MAAPHISAHSPPDQKVLRRPHHLDRGQAAQLHAHKTVFALAVMENAVDVSKFGKNPMTLLVHQY